MHGGYNRQGSGVNAIENALWDSGPARLWRADLSMLGGKSATNPHVQRGCTALELPSRTSPPIIRRESPRVYDAQYDLPVAPILRGKPGTIYAPAGYYGEPGDVPPENYYEGLEISDKDVNS